MDSKQDTDKTPGSFIHPAKYVLTVKNDEDSLIQDENLIKY